MACVLHRSLGKPEPVQGAQQPQALEVLKEALVISLEHRVLPLRYSSPGHLDYSVAEHLPLAQVVILDSILGWSPELGSLEGSCFSLAVVKFALPVALPLGLAPSPVPVPAQGAK